MDVRVFRKVRRNLDAFVRQFDGCIKTKPSRKLMRTYLNGQLGSLERKSIEPIALDAGVPPRRPCRSSSASTAGMKLPSLGVSVIS